MSVSTQGNNVNFTSHLRFASVDCVKYRYVHSDKKSRLGMLTWGPGGVTTGCSATASAWRSSQSAFPRDPNSTHQFFWIFMSWCADLGFPGDAGSGCTEATETPGAGVVPPPHPEAP